MAKDKQQVSAPAVLEGKKGKKDKKAKLSKDKEQKPNGTEAPAQGGGLFSLFGGKSDSQLEDVFSKGVSYTQS